MILEDAQLTQSKLNTFMYEARIKIHCKAEGCTGKNVSIHCKNDLVEYFSCILPLLSSYIEVIHQIFLSSVLFEVIFDDTFLSNIS